MDAQYVKSVKLDTPSFDERLDPQAFIDWTLAIDRYFHWYDMLESRKVWFVIMNLTGQAEQYWKTLERMMQFRRDDPIETWEDMKKKLRLNYIPPSFCQQLLDKWNRLTQENKSATDYITMFDEYLNQCSAIELQSLE